MNDQSRFRIEPRPTTQAAEGLPRWRFTLDEFDRLTEIGLFGAHDRVELIGGEIVPMSPKSVRHETLRALISEWFVVRLPASSRALVELGWRPDAQSYFEPDVLIVPWGPGFVETPAADVQLLIEVALSSEERDMATKAAAYAALGVAEYWVVRDSTREVIVHTEPGEAGYGALKHVGYADRITPQALPSLAFSVDEALAIV
ncbi:MAG: Uma2 family endonuclease [Pseudomonadota bacterium]